MKPRTKPVRRVRPTPTTSHLLVKTKIVSVETRAPMRQQAWDAAFICPLPRTVSYE
jgi:hypothetical protein